MIPYRLFFLCCLLFNQHTNYAQNYFERVIDPDTLRNSNNGWLILPLQDGMLITAATIDFVTERSYIDVVRTDLLGNTVWHKEFKHPTRGFGPCYGIAQMADGNIVLYGDITAGNDGNGMNLCWLTINLDGDSLAYKQIYSSNYENAALKSIYATPDTGMVVGYTKGIFNSYSNSYVSKFDKAGNIVWTTSYNKRTFDATVNMDKTIDNTGYVYTVESTIGGTYNSQIATVVRINNNGDTLWTTTLNETSELVYHPLVRSLLNGNFLVTWCQDTTSFTYDEPEVFYVLDPNGHIIKKQTYPLSYYKGIVSIKLTANGDVLACGETFMNNILGGISGASLRRINPNGEVLWEREYFNPHWYEQGSGANVLFDVAEADNGDIVGTGFVLHNNEQNQGEISIWLLKTNANGCFTPTCNDSIIYTVEPPIVDYVPPIQQAQNKLVVTPNPASNQAIAYLPPALGASAGQVQVFSLTGKLLQSIPYNAKQQIVLFSVAQLPAGIYLVNANGNGTAKLVVAH